MKCEVKDKDMGMGHLWFNGWVGMAFMA